MLRVLLAVLVAGGTAAAVALATEPGAPVGAPGVNRIIKQDRLDLQSRGGNSIQRGTSPHGTSRSGQQRLRDRAPPPPPLPRAEVQIAWGGLRPADVPAT